jgi:hypothetical protein
MFGQKRHPKLPHIYRVRARDEPIRVTSHPNQNHTHTSTRDNLTTMAAIDKAVAAIEARGLGEKPKYRATAKKFGVNCTTLS